MFGAVSNILKASINSLGLGLLFSTALQADKKSFKSMNPLFAIF